MRILPDRDYKKTYNKHYVENYMKLSRKRRNVSKKLKSVTFTSIKEFIVGATVCLIFTGVLVWLSSSFASEYDELNNKIAELTVKVSETNEDIKMYQVINSKEKFNQIDDALTYTVSLQNQYLSGEFDSSFDAYAQYYLGNFNNNWASEEELVNPEWRGFLDTSCDFRDIARMVLILSDENQPKLVATVEFSINKDGNLGSMKSVSKTRLT